ncbi:hypothetical protein D3C72_2381100 [compost metagenome]
MAQAAISHSRPRAPLPGAKTRIRPKITDRAPAAISVHSFSISLRRRMAPMISMMPRMIDQKPIR